MIALGADHGGYRLKEAVKKYLEEKNIEYIDYGCYSEESVNYAVYAQKVANDVANGKCEKGILCCGTGIGISMAANKVKGIRAAVVTNEFCAEMTRRHNDANILAMGGRVIDCETAVKLTDIFLNTPFDGGRHAERIAQIAQIENGEQLQ
ncbi:MAG: ribose 5-phosphate isomerase B [Clostridia bacterium]|nr:ribose 5-phosphate isomerase B [Clostridia bacterium]